MRKVLFIATVPSMIGQFNMNNINLFQSKGFEVHVCCNFSDSTVWSNKKVKEFIDKLDCLGIISHNISFPRSPFSLKNLMSSLIETKKLLKKFNFEIVHCHTPVAAMVVRLVANMSKHRIIYTAHGFHFYKGAPLRNWLFYYPIEKFLSRKTDVIITINHEDYYLAKNRFSACEIFYVPGVGIDLNKFGKVVLSESKKNEIKKLSNNRFLILSIGELSIRKNHISVIKALEKIREKNFEVYDNIHYFIVGQGALKQDLENYIQRNNLNDCISLLGYRDDISELLKMSNLFIFPSLQEGLPVALMEAMASKVICTASDIRGNSDLISEEFLFKNNPAEISKIIEKMYYYPKETLIKTNYKIELNKIDIKSIKSRMEDIYFEK